MPGPRKPPEEHREDEYRPPTRDRHADPVRVHRDYVKAHLAGGAPATPEAYQRALEQWHALPGAVRIPAAELTGPDGLPRAAQPSGEAGDVSSAPHIDADTSEGEDGSS